MPRPFGSPLTLAPELARQLQVLARAASTPQALAFRCRLNLRVARDDHCLRLSPGDALTDHFPGAGKGADSSNSSRR
jgi:hypothetical protein